MRAINNIVLHCTGTPKNTTIESIQRYWREVLKWKNPGYHYIVQADGRITPLQPISLIANGVAGHNPDSIHVAYIGGEKFDDRTPEQARSMLGIVRELQLNFPGVRVCGHRDFPGVTKECPRFDVKEWIGKYNTI